MGHQKRESGPEEFNPKIVRNGNGSFQALITWLLGTVVALCTIAGFAYRGIADFAYPKAKGETLEQSVKELKEDIKTQTQILTEVRILVAQGVRAEARSVNHPSGPNV